VQAGHGLAAGVEGGLQSAAALGLGRRSLEREDVDDLHVAVGSDAADEGCPIGLGGAGGLSIHGGQQVGPVELGAGHSASLGAR
jgi:hypothetical protein